MSRIDTHQSSKLTFAEGDAAATPASGLVHLYAKTDGLLYSKDDAGDESAVSGTGGGGDITTDAAWAAAGDLIVGSGNDTASVLTKGAAGAVLAMGNSAVIWNAGTSFPASKATGDRYFRTDLGMEFYWDGTRWVTTQVLTLSACTYLVGSDAGWIFPLHATYQMYLVDWDISAYVGSDSATWVISLQTIDVEFDAVSLDSISADTAAGNTQDHAAMYRYTRSLGVVVDGTAAHGANAIRALRVWWDETAGAASFIGAVTLRYRLIAT